MPENVMPGTVRDLSRVRESVCIHTKKIFDSCRDKDCLEDLRFYPTEDAQTVLENAQNTRGGSAELLYTFECTYCAGALAGKYMAEKYVRRKTD